MTPEPPRATPAHRTTPAHSKPTGETPPHKGVGASKAEHAVRHAPDSAVAPHEKRTIGAETSREEDA